MIGQAQRRESTTAEGGPGRQARAGLAALALVALVGSVAAAAATTATVASVVHAIAAPVATLSLTLAAIATETRRSKGRRSRSVVGVECLRGRRRRAGAEHEFLQDQVVSNLVEGR
jgi:hypothetical protein